MIRFKRSIPKREQKRKGKSANIMNGGITNSFAHRARACSHRTHKTPTDLQILSGGFQSSFKYDLEYSIASDGEILDLSVIDKNALGIL